jgi:hypothetical protein
MLLIGAVGFRSKGQKGKGGVDSPAMEGPARAALLVDGELAPVIGDGEEEADAMQKWTVNSGVWSVATNASCSDGEWRLETGWPRSRTWASMPCRLEPEEGFRRCAREILRGEDQREDTGSLSHAGIDDGRHGYLQTPVRNRGRMELSREWG